MVVLGLLTAHKQGVEVYVERDGVISHHVFPTTLSDSLVQAIDSVVQPSELGGIVVLSGPGSFTAVRSAVVVANTLAAARNIPVVGEEQKGDTLLAMQAGVARILKGENQFPLAPQYDREPNISQPKSISTSV